MRWKGVEAGRKQATSYPAVPPTSAVQGWSQDFFALLKFIDDPKEPLFL